MGKVLLTKKNFKEHLTIIDQTVYMEGSYIVSPGVKDILRNQGIAIKYGSRPASKKDSKKDIQENQETCSNSHMTPVHESEQVVESGQNSEDKKMSANEVARIVRQVLENSFDTVDENMIEEVLRRLLKTYTF